METEAVFVAPRPPLEVAATRPIAVIPEIQQVGRVLAAMKRASGLSQAEIATRMGSTQQRVSEVLRGRRERMSLDWFSRYVTACGGRLLVEVPK